MRFLTSRHLNPLDASFGDRRETLYGLFEPVEPYNIRRLYLSVALIGMYALMVEYYTSVNVLVTPLGATPIGEDCVSRV
jgi:hypothetical protein